MHSKSRIAEPSADGPVFSFWEDRVSGDSVVKAIAWGLVLFSLRFTGPEQR